MKQDVFVSVTGNAYFINNAAMREGGASGQRMRCFYRGTAVLLGVCLGRSSPLFYIM